jgi:hypothetical protein
MRAKVKSLEEVARCAPDVVCCAGSRAAQRSAQGMEIELAGDFVLMAFKCAFCGISVASKHCGVVGQPFQWVDARVIDIDEGSAG